MDPSRISRLVPFITFEEKLVSFGARDGIKEAMMLEKSSDNTVRLHLDDTLSDSDCEREESVTIQQISDDDGESQARWPNI